MKEEITRIEGEMKAGFAAVAERSEKTPTREEMNEGFAAVNGRLDKIHHLIWSFGGTLVVSLIGCVITLIATRV